VQLLRADIRVFDNKFNFLGEISDYEEFVLVKRLTRFGEFQISINFAKASARLFKVGNFIYIDKERSGIIEHIERRMGGISDKGETLFVKGFTPEHLLSYRVTYPYPGLDSWSMVGCGESVIKALVRYNMGDLAKDINRVIPLVDFAPDEKRGKELSISTDYKKLHEEAASAAALTGLGIKMIMDVELRKFIFDVLSGRDLTSLQTVLPPVIFSSEYDNVFSQCYTDSRVSYRNVAIVDSRRDSIGREIAFVNNEISGENRRELFVSGGSIPRGEADKQRELGALRLNDMVHVKALDGVINPHHSFKYGVDYKLGDIVTMKYDDITLHAPITEVTEKWTAKDGYGLKAAIGGCVPTLIDRILLAMHN